ncbi:branched-chain amino acid ABC transporter permease [Paraburkholderia tropica]|uniref:branched-chain amino acid ABC transporter permease n=1 Tax=Paraburkholderia tropica TaxID=92647 RepID=UPI001F1A905F|nr:branched-chain amino acid ABC transporter permease [Paraburkholderia tropica]
MRAKPHADRPFARTPHTRVSALMWLALAVLLVAPPLVSAWLSPSGAPQGWLLACLAQTAAMIVFALSYNLLLGETGLLSFGHAVPAGLGALAAAHCFNRYAMALPLLPVIGGVAGAAVGALTACVAARRAGTAFAMITLGLGELVAAAAWALPGWFGGEAGVPIDRASGPALAGWSFGPDRQAYWLIAAWCFAACVAMRVLSRAPFVRLANAVRDNPRRAASLGASPARVRAAMIVLGSAFAGVAGTLALINVELAAAESVGMMRSAAVLIATVTGGAGAFFGPVLGALVWVAFSVGVASLSRAWMLYVGVFFIVVVLMAPEGLAGLAARERATLARNGWRACVAPWCLALLAAISGTLAFVLAVQWAYAIRFGDDDASANAFAALSTHAQWSLGAAIGVFSAIGWLAARRASALRRARFGANVAHPETRP